MTKYSAQKSYDERNGVKRFTIKVSPKTEQDIIDKLESVPQKATYIKRLIREDIARSK